MNRPKSGAPSLNSLDRYAILQRKVEDLERVHVEGKKAHQLDVERLKSELSKYQKQHMESTEIIEKERKKNSLLETRVRELKRTNGSEEAELKDARAKLRTLESERNRLQASSSEVQDLKNALQSSETRRKEESRESDNRIAALEKALAQEKKEGEGITTQQQQQSKASESAARVATKRLQALVDQKTAESLKLREELAQAQGSSSNREEELISQLERYNSLISHVASDYGKLFARSVQRSSFEELEDQHRSLQAKHLKLGRKLANSESQVLELVHLIRQIQGDNALLKEQFRDAVEEITLLREHIADSIFEPPLTVVDEEHPFSSIQEQLQTLSDIQETTQLHADFYRLYTNSLAIHSRLLNAEIAVTDDIVEEQSAELSEALTSHRAVTSRLEVISTEYAHSAEQVARAAADKQCVERDIYHLKSQLEEKDTILRDIESKHKQALRKERETIQRLNGTVQKERMAEEALRQEIDKLSTELQGLEWYEQAYENLNKQIALLVSRNKIAEEEATELSQCNAEILGHHNPAQRIMYVDRIRRELAEAKQQIAELTLEKERAEAQGDQLQQELDMYTSVMVPVGSKPRTNLTRVTRVPLSSLPESLNQSSLAPSSRSSGLRGSAAREVYTSPTDMTVDDLA